MVAISPFARLIREHRRENPLSYPIAARLGGDDAREGGRGHSCPATPTQSEELGTTRPLSHTPERARRAYRTRRFASSIASRLPSGRRRVSALACLDRAARRSVSQS